MLNNAPTKNPSVLAWLEDKISLVNPDKVVWIDGSEEERERLTKQALSTGEMMELDQEKLPGCLYHRTAENDVARVEGRTFICSKVKEDSAPINNWMETSEAMKLMNEITAPEDGIIISMEAENEAMVEYNEILMKLQPANGAE